MARSGLSPYAAAAIAIAALAAQSPVNAGNPPPVTCGTQDGDARYCPRPESDGGIGIGLLVLPIAAVILLGKEMFGGDGIDSAKDLDRDGPRRSVHERLGQFGVQGVISPGWPVVVEARWQPGATTFLQITPNDMKKSAIPPLILSEEGGTLRRDYLIRHTTQYPTENGVLTMFVLPDSIGKSQRGAFKGARFTVFSGRITGEGKDTKLEPMPLEVFAIGAGPNAVGSAAVVIRSFAAVPPTRRAAFTVMFNERRKFGNLRAELIRRDVGQREITRKPIESKDLCLDSSGREVCLLGPPVKPYTIPGEWPLQTGSQLPPGSTYHMNLRAWSKRAVDGGWVIAQAPQVLVWP